MKNTVCVTYKGFTISAPICDHRPEYSNFLVRESMLREGIICFIYKDSHRKMVRKAIPTMHILEAMKRHSFMRYDEDEECYKYSGYAYLIPDEFIFNYKA